jgi:Sulfotransferase family
MPLTTRTSRVLIIAGMHRSGTSLLANWLQQCGLHIGDELVPGGIGNPLGHFEDTEFLNFHQAVLNDNHLDTLVTHQEIDISEAQYQTAVAMVAKRAGHPQWGWKDPRTCLFIGLWKDVIPDADVICIHKRQAAGEHPIGEAATVRQQVHDFITLGFSVGHQVKVVRFYLQTWTRHNQEILRFAKAHPADILLIQNRDLQVSSTAIVNFLVENWGFDLKPVDFSQVYQPTMMTRRQSIFYKFAVFALAPSCTLTYRQMMLFHAETMDKIAKSPHSHHRFVIDLRSALTRIGEPRDHLHFGHHGAA